jgi:hypothetical protein
VVAAGDLVQSVFLYSVDIAPGPVVVVVSGYSGKVLLGQAR